MYRNLPLELLVANPDNANRISRMYAKKLRHNIEQLGMYEALTVRPHPKFKGEFEILNGHSRAQALRELGIERVKCDIWKVTDEQAQLFLAILNKLRGTDVPELRMSLLFKLLRQHSQDTLAAHIPETADYLAKLQRLSEEIAKSEEPIRSEKPGVAIVQFYLTSEQHDTVSTVLAHISRKFELADSSEALAKMAALYLQGIQERDRMAAA